MKPLLLLAAVFYMVSWKEWAAESQAYHDMGATWGEHCELMEKEKSETFGKDETNYKWYEDGKPQKSLTPREAAELRASQLRKEPQKYWDIKTKRIEETELSK